MHLRAALVLTVVATTAGCASAGRTGDSAPARRAGPALTLLDAAVLPPVTEPPGGRREAQFGSVSGLARDAQSGRYLAVIDDRQPSRVAWMDITYDGRLSVTPGPVIPIVPGEGMDARIVTGADLEAIAALPDGTWVVCEEGHRSSGARGQPPAGEWPPALFTLDRSLAVTRVEGWPATYGIGPERGGVRDNQGVESLTRTPDGRLVAGLEQPRHADMPATLRNGRPFGGGRGGPGRLVEFTLDGGTWRAGREWVYPLSPTPRRPDFPNICDDGENGLTELLAIDEARFFALERACLQNPVTRVVRNTVQLYLADVSSADDVSATLSGQVRRARPVRKTLLLDFDALIPHLPPALVNLDNFEAMAFGPDLPDGRRTLLVVSDDNFRATQSTAVLLLAIDEGR